MMDTRWCCVEHGSLMSLDCGTDKLRPGRVCEMRSEVGASGCGGRDTSKLQRRPQNGPAVARLGGTVQYRPRCGVVGQRGCVKK
jgi:hypothetical protein